LRIRFAYRRGILNAPLVAFFTQLKPVVPDIKFPELVEETTLLHFDVDPTTIITKMFNNLHSNTEYKVRFRVSDTDTISDFSTWKIFKTRNFGK